MLVVKWYLCLKLLLNEQFNLRLLRQSCRARMVTSMTSFVAERPSLNRRLVSGSSHLCQGETRGCLLPLCLEKATSSNCHPLLLPGLPAISHPENRSFLSLQTYLLKRFMICALSKNTGLGLNYLGVLNSWLLTTEPTRKAISRSTLHFPLLASKCFFTFPTERNISLS